jgi:hypothetical protein
MLKLSFAETDPCYPNQVHLNIGDAYYGDMYDYLGKNSPQPHGDNAATIVWQTTGYCPGSYLMLSSDSQKDVIHPPDEVTNFTDHYNCFYQSTIYVVKLYNVAKDQHYSYSISTADNLTTVGPYTFKLFESSKAPTSFLVFGDADASNLGNQTLHAFNNLAATNKSSIDGMLQLGDLAYNLYTNCQKNGEIFFNTLQPAIAQWPFIVTPGNHEADDNYASLNMRLRDPLFNKSQNHFFSFNAGYAHYIVFNFDFYDDAENDTQTQIMTALISDLEDATKAKKQWPWLIVMSHRPIYCSYNNPEDQEKGRCYNFYGRWQIFDELWQKYKVDMHLSGHLHAYERISPTYKNISQVGTFKPAYRYKNPNATIFIVNGISGNGYWLNPDYPRLPYSELVSLSLGFGKLSIYNEYELLYEQYDSSNGNVIDHVWIVRTNGWDNEEAYETIVGILSIILAIYVFLSFIHCFTRGKTGKRVNDNEAHEQQQLVQQT